MSRAAVYMTGANMRSSRCLSNSGNIKGSTSARSCAAMNDMRKRDDAVCIAPAGAGNRPLGIEREARGRRSTSTFYRNRRSVCIGRIYIRAQTNAQRMAVPRRRLIALRSGDV
jgi:hypothetical protein